MILEAQMFAPDDGVRCMQCDKPYNFRLGGIVWHKYGGIEKQRELFICQNCAPMVVAGLVNDLRRLDCFCSISKRHAEYIVKAGDSLKSLMPVLDDK